MFLYSCICICKHTYMQMHIFMHIHIHGHTCIPTCRPAYLPAYLRTCTLEGVSRQTERPTDRPTGQIHIHNYILRAYALAYLLTYLLTLHRCTGTSRHLTSLRFTLSMLLGLTVRFFAYLYTEGPVPADLFRRDHGYSITPHPSLTHEQTHTHTAAHTHTTKKNKTTTRTRSCTPHAPNTTPETWKPRGRNIELPRPFDAFGCFGSAP